MGMIDDQTTGPWIEKNQQRENISVILKVNHHIQYQFKKNNFCLCTNYDIFRTKYMRLKSIAPYYLWYTCTLVIQVEKGVVVLL